MWYYFGSRSPNPRCDPNGNSSNFRQVRHWQTTSGGSDDGANQSCFNIFHTPNSTHYSKNHHAGRCRSHSGNMT